jgi:uncharacterized protein with von Willebrand factor type A (vWA) domain
MNTITKRQADHLVTGSLYEVAKRKNQSIAETFIGCDVVILVDTSGSMSITDSRGGKSRYDVACDELKALQGSLPGKIAVLSFSSDVAFCPSGVATFMGSGTDMAKALKFAKVADAVPGMRFILISDGEPDSRSEALAAAQTYQNRVDTLYVGPEDMPSGRDFLQQLAKASFGDSVTADRAKELKSGVEKLLLKAG